MKKYKEELQRFALSEEDKKNLKYSVLQSDTNKKQKSSRIPYVRFATFALVTMLFIFFLISPQHEVEMISGGKLGFALDGDGLNLSRAETDPNKRYTPQDGSFIGGLGAAGGDCTVGKTGNANDYTYGGAIKETEPSTLPIYDIKQVSEEEKKSFLAKVISDLKLTVSFDNSKGTLYDTDKQMSIQQEYNGDITITGSQAIDLEYDESDKYLEQYGYGIDLMMDYVDTYEDEILKPLGFRHASYSVILEQLSSYSILISEDGGNEYDNQKECRSVTFRLEKLDLEGEYSFKFYPVFHIKAGLDVSFNRTITPISLKEAETILWKNGFYSSIHHRQLYETDEVINYDIVYRNFKNRKEEPVYFYQLPCYRFYVKTGSGMRALDVIAIAQNELRTLDKITWYMDKP